MKEKSCCFTDGSRTNERAGASVFADSGRFKRHITLGQHATVFQAEVFEILSCGLENNIRLIWWPGHSDIPGNEEADRLARLGAQVTPIGPEPFVGISKSTATRSMGALARQLFHCRIGHEIDQGTHRWPQSSEN